MRTNYWLIAGAAVAGGALVALLFPGGTPPPAGEKPALATTSTGGVSDLDGIIKARNLTPDEAQAALRYAARRHAFHYGFAIQDEKPGS